MDNLTHTLIGALAGETLARTTTADSDGLPTQTRRNLFVTLATVGSSLPDIDLLYSYFDGKVNYLLHHRGHTHTVLGALLLAALAYAIVIWLLRKRHLRVSHADRFWIAAILSVTGLLHVLMDGMNSYGVHPFWPLYNGWVYGDALFIIEPLFWLAAAPLVFCMRTWLARIVIFAVVLLGVYLSFSSALVPTANAVIFALLAVAMLILGYRSPPRVAVIAGITLWLSTTLMFFTASRIARIEVSDLAARATPQAQLLDSIVTPMPVNPICWEVVMVQSEGDSLALRRGMLSIAPSLMSVEACPARGLDVPSTAPLQAVGLTDSKSFKWYGEVFTSRRELKELVGTDCIAAAGMRFIRAPWLTTVDGTRVLGDLRYDREQDLSFAELELDGTSPCPRVLAPWLPPREDVLFE